MAKFLDDALIGKVIKSAEKKPGHYPVIYFEDGSQLDIYVDDLEELVLELMGSKIAEFDNKLKESESKIDTLQTQVDGFIEANKL